MPIIDVLIVLYNGAIEVIELDQIIRLVAFLTYLRCSLIDYKFSFLSFVAEFLRRCASVICETYKTRTGFTRLSPSVSSSHLPSVAVASCSFIVIANFI